MSIHLHELGTAIAQLTQEKRMAFPRFIYQGTQEAVGTRSLVQTFPITRDSTTSPHFIP